MFAAEHLLIAAIGGIGSGLLLAGWCGEQEPEGSPSFMIGMVVMLFAAVGTASALLKHWLA